MPCDVICISSEDGTGALGAASLAARALGFRLIDEDIVTRAAQDAGVEREVVADVERRRSLLERVLDSLGTSGMAAGYVPVPLEQTPSDDLRSLIRSVIEETAAVGQAIIVSHAASLALGGRENVLRVMFTASPETRARRLAASMGVEEREAEKVLQRSDAGRADYIKRFYGIGQELPTHYDLVINTDKLSPELGAELITQAARS